MSLPLPIAIATLMTLSAMSLAAGHRLAGTRLLPMFRGPNGRPRWSAPRAVALTLTPALAAAILTVALFPTITGPRATGTWYCGIIIAVCICLVSVHAAYLGAISRPVPVLGPSGRTPPRR